VLLLFSGEYFEDVVRKLLIFVFIWGGGFRDL